MDKITEMEADYKYEPPKEGSYYCPECKIKINDGGLQFGLMCPNCKKSNVVFNSPFRWGE